MAFGFMHRSDRVRLNHICDLTDDIISIVAADGDISRFREKVGELLEEKKGDCFFDQRYFWMIFFTIMTHDKEEYLTALKKMMQKDEYMELIEYCMTSYSVFNGYIFYSQLFLGNSETKKEIIMDLAKYEKDKNKSANGWGFEESEEIGANSFLKLKYSLIKFGTGDLIKQYSRAFEGKSEKELSIYLYFAAKQRRKDIMQALFDIGLRFSIGTEGFLMLLINHMECITDFLLPHFGKYMLKNYDEKKVYSAEDFIYECFGELDDESRFGILSALYNYFEQEECDRIKAYIPKIKYIVDGEENHFYNDDIYDLSRVDFIEIFKGCFDEDELIIKIKDGSLLRNVFCDDRIKELSRNVTIDISDVERFDSVTKGDFIRIINNYNIIDDNDGVTLFKKDIIRRNSKRVITAAYQKGFINRENFKEILNFAASEKKIKALAALSSLSDKILDNNSLI